MCRRVVYDDGQARMWGDTNHPNFTELEGGNDSGIELIYTYDENKELTGVVANIACPAQVVEHRSFISSDYWGKVRENLRRHFGKDIKVLGLCSAAGDQCPRDMIRWVNPESPIDDPNIKRDSYIERRADPSMFDLSGLRLVGKRISNEIISVYEELDGELCDEAFLEHRTLKLPFPLRRVTISEYEDAPEKLWESNMFGRSLYDLVSDGMKAKLEHMPDESREKLGETLERIINEGAGGLLCILL
jgi:hypothetical protein